VRSGHLRGNEEFEVGRERNTTLSEFDEQVVALLFDLLSEQGIKHWVECFVCVFKDNRNTHRDCCFQLAGHNLLVHRWLDYLELRLKTVFEPDVGLHLGVNEQAPSV
jgi:hypothetical protein